MFEPIDKISNLSKFKEDVFKGKIFVFKKSEITLDLVQEIKKNILIEYDGQLEKLHHLDNRREAPNTDCDLQWQFPKIFRNIDDNSPLKLLAE